MLHTLRTAKIFFFLFSDKKFQAVFAVYISVLNPQGCFVNLCKRRFENEDLVLDDTIASNKATTFQGKIKWGSEIPDVSRFRIVIVMILDQCLKQISSEPEKNTVVGHKRGSGIADNLACVRGWCAV